MSSIFSASSAALLILQQSSLPLLSAGAKPAIDDPVLTAGNGDRDASGGRETSILARARITEALFGVNSLDPMKMKANLFERLGKEFGLSVDDFESVSSFGRAIRHAVGQLRLTQEGRVALAAIETKLELGKLGLSVDTLVEAMIDPGGDADEAVEAALLQEAGEEQEKALATLRPFTLDEAGLYTA